MNDESAFPAVFRYARQVRDHVIFGFEVPAERATEYLAKIGGYPASGESRWFGIARLDMEAIANAGAPPTTAGALEDLNGRAVGGDTPPRSPTLANHISKLCNIPTFQGFLLDLNGTWLTDPKERVNWSRQYVRDYCGVSSLTEIIEGSPAHGLWCELELKYRLENKV